MFVKGRKTVTIILGVMLIQADKKITRKVNRVSVFKTSSHVNNSPRFSFKTFETHKNASLTLLRKPTSRLCFPREKTRLWFDERKIHTYNFYFIQCTAG